MIEHQKKLNLIKCLDLILNQAIMASGLGICLQMMTMGILLHLARQENIY